MTNNIDDFEKLEDQSTEVETEAEVESPEEGESESEAAGFELTVHLCSKVCPKCGCNVQNLGHQLKSIYTHGGYWYKCGFCQDLFFEETEEPGEPAPTVDFDELRKPKDRKKRYMQPDNKEIVSKILYF